MSNKPKQWGPHASPEGLGKLRTAVVTLPDQKYVSVFGPGFRAKKAGDYQEVATTSEDGSVTDELLSVGADVQFGPPVGKAAPISGIGFHKKKYKGGEQIAVNRFWGYRTHNYSIDGYELPYTSRKGEKKKFRFYQRNTILDINVVNSNGKKLASIGMDGISSPLLNSNFSRFLLAPETVSLGRSDPYGFGIMTLYSTLDAVDAWGIPASKAKFISLLFDKNSGFSSIKGELVVPANPVGETSEVSFAAMSPQPGHAITLVAQYPPDPISYEAAGEELWAVELSAGYRRVQFENCLPRFWFFKTTDYGKTWGAPWRFHGFDTMTPALSHYYPGGIGEPLFGWFTHTESAANGLIDDLYPWGSSPRVDFLLMSQMIASSPNHYLLFAIVRDRRQYPDIGFVEWRSVVFRTTDGGVTWAEVETPFSSLASSIPKKANDDKTYAAEEAIHYFPFVIRAGVLIVKCAKGLQSHVARELAFIRSEDHGATWQEFTPSGLPLSTSYQLGMFSNAVTSAGKTVLLIPAWDGECYRMYVSKDEGFTWKKGGRIHKPSEFSNMDYPQVINPVSVSGNSFGSIQYVPSNQRLPIDPGCPWRVDARFEYGEKV